MKESDFQQKLAKRIRDTFEGSLVIKGPSNQYQGITDLIILYKNHWAGLECKAANNSKKQKNQSYYVSKLNEMSFARLVSPENEEEVFNELQQAFGD